MGELNISECRDRAFRHFKMGEYSDAEYFFRCLCHSTPSWEAWYYRGLASKYQGMLESALYCFYEALPIEQNEIDDLPIYGPSSYHIGHINTRLGNRKAAMEYLRLSMKDYPEYPITYILIALNMIDFENSAIFDECMNRFRQYSDGIRPKKESRTYESNPIVS